MSDYKSTFPTIDTAAIENKIVLVRVDFNVKLNNQDKVSDPSRIVSALPTLKKLSDGGNKIILMTHFGRPKEKESEFSTRRLIPSLRKYTPYKTVHFIENLMDPESVKLLASSINKDEIILLENLRFYPEESKNDTTFARNLSRMADVYVNDAFGVSHRAHASVVGVVAHLTSFAGLLLQREVETILGALLTPCRPLVTIVGGAKISTKLHLLSNLRKKADYVLVGGGLANTLFKAQGHTIGRSIVENDLLKKAKTLLENPQKGGQLVVPQDVRYGMDGLTSRTGTETSVDSVPEEACILDIGPTTEKLFARHIAHAKTIVWNGPVGMFETPAFSSGTHSTYENIVANEAALSVVGGGDTLAAIAKESQNDKISHISTGGGAMLELMEKNTLPAIKALEGQKNH